MSAHLRLVPLGLGLLLLCSTLLAQSPSAPTLIYVTPDAIGPASGTFGQFNPTVKPPFYPDLLHPKKKTILQPFDPWHPDAFKPVLPSNLFPDLPAPAPVHKDDYNKQTIPESQVYEALHLKPQDLPSSIFAPRAGAPECTEAERVLRNTLSTEEGKFVTAWMDKFLSNADLILPSPALMNQHSVEVLENYQLKCSSPLSAIKAGSDLRTSTSDVVGVLLHRVGSHWGILCSVTRIAPGIVLTARHCFYTPDTITVSPFLASEIKAKRFKVILPERNIELPVTGTRCEQPGDLSKTCLQLSLSVPTAPGFDSDVILLEVREPGDLAPPKVTLGSANVKKGLPIMLVGWNMYAAIAASYSKLKDQGSAAKIGTKESIQVRMSRGGLCYVASVKGACITHTCQATPGSSGAALFEQLPGGNLRVVGIHVSDTNADPSYLPKGTCDLSMLAVTPGFYDVMRLPNFGNAGRLVNR